MRVLPEHFSNLFKFETQTLILEGYYYFDPNGTLTDECRRKILDGEARQTMISTEWSISMRVDDEKSRIVVNLNRLDIVRDFKGEKHLLMFPKDISNIDYFKPLDISLDYSGRLHTIEELRLFALEK